MPRIDLNVDLGEGGVCDAEVMASASSVNIACGFHAGDAPTMLRTLGVAAQHGVAVGAHPGFPDRAHFGRRAIERSPAEIEADVLYQLGALGGLARSLNLRLAHVKPHGALYNRAASEEAAARAICRAVQVFDSSLVLFALSGSTLATVGVSMGLTVAAEVFADRAYLPDGSLKPRDQPGAVISDPSAVLDRARAFARDGAVLADDGSVLRLAADTICLHGDTPGAAESARAIRAALEEDGIEVAPVPHSATSAQ